MLDFTLKLNFQISQIKTKPALKQKILPKQRKIIIFPIFSTLQQLT